jgi:hypothetical protein
MPAPVHEPVCDRHQENLHEAFRGRPESSLVGFHGMDSSVTARQTEATASWLPTLTTRMVVIENFSLPGIPRTRPPKRNIQRRALWVVTSVPDDLRSSSSAGETLLRRQTQIIQIQRFVFSSASFMTGHGSLSTLACSIAIHR